MVIPQYVSDILLISKGIGAITAQSKIYNTGKMFKEKSRINCYQIAYRFLLVVGLSFGRQVVVVVFFFSEKAVNCFSLHCVHFSLRVSHSSAVERAVFTDHCHYHPSLQAVLSVFLDLLFWFKPSMRSLPRKHSCKLVNLGLCLTIA